MITTNSKNRKTVVEPSPQIKKEIYKPICRNIYFNGYSYRFRFRHNGKCQSQSYNLNSNTSYWVNKLSDWKKPLGFVIIESFKSIVNCMTSKDIQRSKFEKTLKNLQIINTYRTSDFLYIGFFEKALNGNIYKNDEEILYSFYEWIYKNIDSIYDITEKLENIIMV